MKWNYIVNGTSQDSISEEGLRNKFIQGTLPIDTPVWREGLAKWIKASDLQEFSGIIVNISNTPSIKDKFSSEGSKFEMSNTSPKQGQLGSESSKFEGFRTYNVGGFTYLMAYFEAKFVGTGSVGAVADQFTQFVSNYAAKGFEFFRCDEVPFRVTPGCLSGLLGAKESYGHCTIVTFRKKMD